MRTQFGAAGRALIFCCVIATATGGTARAGWIWVEGEKPAASTMHRHPYWYDQVKKDRLSGGDLISNFDKRPGEATYRFQAPKAGDYTLWVRANPVLAKLSYRLNGGKATAIDTSTGLESTNIAADDKPDLRFLAWVKAGTVPLKKGTNAIVFRMDGTENNHGYIDCFVLTDEAFTPRGIAKPDQLADVRKKLEAANAGWFAWEPKPDGFAKTSAIDLRGLNEKTDGDGGFIGARGGHFVHTKTGEPVRFWAVNGPSGKSKEDLKREARILAKRGVNLVRVHHAVFDGTGEVDPTAVQRAFDVVDAMKTEGIYAHFSIYFPLWLQPKPDTPWLKGYDGNKHPFAALLFNEDFQKRYRGWWKALLETPNPATGKRLVDDPAVMGLEMQNEDSFFFWTFNPEAVPDAELRIVEAKFGAWLKKKYGSIEAAQRAWGGQAFERDRPAEGRMGFRPLWNMANERIARDRDAARFLTETQRSFYEETYKYLRSLGFRGVITASNWTTADPRVLGPLEKYTYTVGDFIDRHGYFGCRSRGDESGWSVRDGHMYMDRSALRFDAEEPGKPRVFAHPAMDPKYDDKPSMISETTWNRPNRYRSEAPLYYACYGALQDSDAIVHFAYDGAEWSVKPGFWTQPWTLMTPAMMGQFPAAALIFRRGLVSPGDVLVDLGLNVEQLLELKGTPLPQDAALDELRLKDVPKGSGLKPGEVIDPLVHYAGRVNVRFMKRGAASKVGDISKWVDRAHKTVTSTNKQLRLDYGKGALTIDAPQAQGVSGALRELGSVETSALTVSSGMDLVHIMVVAMDGKPLKESAEMLLQVMSEERAADFGAEDAPDGMKKITSIGHDPWLVRKLEGTVGLKRPDAGRLKVTALDLNGEPVRAVGSAERIALEPGTVYYRIAR